MSGREVLQWLSLYGWFVLLLCAILVCTGLLLVIYVLPPREALLARLLLALLDRLASIIEQHSEGNRSYDHAYDDERIHDESNGSGYPREHDQPDNHDPVYKRGNSHSARKGSRSDSNVRSRQYDGEHDHDYARGYGPEQDHGSGNKDRLSSGAKRERINNRDRRSRRYNEPVRRPQGQMQRKGR